MSKELDGRVVLITGAGKGLGRSYALWCARAGAKVVVNNRVRDGVASSAQSVVNEIVALGGTAVAEHSPVETRAGAAAMVSTAIETFGQLDVLICNAGVVDDVRITDMSFDKMHEVMNINFWGSLYPLHAALPGMIANAYGRIVLSASQAALFGQRKSALYSASKAALIGLARATALDMRRYDIHVNVIAPAAYTPMASAKLDAKWADLMSPDKVAPVVGWLASEQCMQSGMIFNSGAGRIRRARILETAPVAFGDDVNSAMLQLNDMPSELEAAESYDSGRILIPETFVF